MSKFDDETLSNLFTYFSSSYSFNGKLKLIQTLDSSMNVLTSSSSRLIRPLKCQRTISRLVFAAIEKQHFLHHDGGFYYAMIFTKFLRDIRENSIQLNDLQNCLTLIEQIKINFQSIDFNSIRPILALVRGVFCKPLAFNYSDRCREEICLLIVKAFLEKITSTEQHLLTIEGLPIEQSKLFVGLLFPIYSKKSLDFQRRTRRCLYFTISLAGDHLIEDLDVLQTRDDLFRWIENVAQRLSDTILKYSQLHHGGLVLCQKVIHPSIKIQLKQMGIETIDRLSQSYTSLFCSITGCQPIETLNFDQLDEEYFGTITDLQSIKILDKDFLLFINEHRPFHTLLLCSTSEQSLLELKECFKSSEEILMKTLTTRKAFFGAGCSESEQIFLLRQQIPSMSSRLLCQTLIHLLRSQYDENLVIDLSHGHLWFVSDNDRISSFCACQFYRANSLFENEWKTRVFSLDLDEQIFKRNDSIVDQQNSAKFLDSFSMKSQTMKNAVETAINLYLTNVYL